MAAQKVVISKDLKADLQAFFASMSYDRLFILTDTNTQEKCFPLVKDIPALQDAPIITVKAGDTHKDIEQVAYIWSRLSNEGASRNSFSQSGRRYDYRYGRFCRCDFQTWAADRQYPDYPDGLCRCCCRRKDWG
jgi:hypothetical protein